MTELTCSLIILFMSFSFFMWHRSNKRLDSILGEMRALRKDLQEEKTKYRVH